MIFFNKFLNIINERERERERREKKKKIKIKWAKVHQVRSHPSTPVSDGLEKQLSLFHTERPRLWGAVEG